MSTRSTALHLARGSWKASQKEAGVEGSIEAGGVGSQHAEEEVGVLHSEDHQ